MMMRKKKSAAALIAGRNSSRTNPPTTILDTSQVGGGGSTNIPPVFGRSELDLDLSVDEEELTVSIKSSPTLNEFQKQSQHVERMTKRTQLAALLVVLMGAAAGGSFLYLGITSANNDVNDQFDRRATDMAYELDGAWKDFERGTLWVHQSCADWRNTNQTACTLEGFEKMYHYIISGGVEFTFVEWVPNVTHAERQQLEADAQVIWGREGIQTYSGIMGKEPVDAPDNSSKLQYGPRSEQPFYFPIHFAEPRIMFQAHHYDLYSAPDERPAIDRAIETWQPVLTGRFWLLGHDQDDGWSVVLYHPGVPLPQKFNVERPRDLACTVIRISNLLKRATRFLSESMSIYLFDKTVTVTDSSNPPEFLSGIEILVHDNNGDNNNNQKQQTTILPEKSYASLQDSDICFEQEINVGGRTWVVVAVPADSSFEPDLTFIILGGILIVCVSVLLAVWMLNNMNQSIKMYRVMWGAAAESLIVDDMFPPSCRDRLIQDADARYRGHPSGDFSTKDVFRSSMDGGRDELSERKMNNFLTSEGVFGSKPIAELHPYTTVIYADIVGFSAWASVREPDKVFTFLELVYHSWDQIAKRRKVFKVETVRDKYTAVAGLPDPCKDHAVAIAKFATDCAHRVRVLCQALEKTLGPGTGDLACRFGIHSGQVIAGVLRGNKGRFQLFGDTVHRASQIEATCPPNKIQMSQETAELLMEAGHGKWCIPRGDSVVIKGKGSVQTFFLHVQSESQIYEECAQDLSSDLSLRESNKTDRLIEWNVQVLSGLLQSIIARRQALAGCPKLMTNDSARHSMSRKGNMVLDEVVEVITLPPFNASVIKRQVDPSTIQLDRAVVRQLTKLVETIASMYRNNPFHNFAHASHVVMSVVKMMARIVDPKELAINKRKKHGDVGAHAIEAELHDHTFGITSDPLTQFACAFSALIHDLDHHGVPNMVLVKEEAPLAKKYRNKSILEQNSVDLAWSLLMKPDFKDLRDCIGGDSDEFARFRALVVNAVMATDVMDKELNAARMLRWNRAFSEGDDWMGQQEGPHVKSNRKATIILEHLMMASDISHTMQHWHVYAKWNEKLFQEMYKAHKDGRLAKDPSRTWYEDELGFFDNYIIPLAEKLFKCGVFGVSSDEFKNYAQINRKEWADKGGDMVQTYLANFDKGKGGQGDE